MNLTSTSNGNRLSDSLNLFSLQQTRMRRKANIYSTLLIKLTEDISPTVAIASGGNFVDFEFLTKILDCLGDGRIGHAWGILGQKLSRIEAGRVFAWCWGTIEEIWYDGDVALFGKVVG
jgi:hypothetical protein